MTNTAIASPLLLAYLIQSSSIFIELLVSGIASVVYEINGNKIKKLYIYKFWVYTNKQSFIQTSLQLVLFS